MSYDYKSFLGPHLEDYLDMRVRFGATSFHRDTRARALDFYAWSLGLTSLEQLTEKIVLNWMHSVPTHAPATKNAYLSFARRFFDYLLRQGLIRQNPTKFLPDVKAPRYRPYLYSLLEIAKILEAATTTFDRDPDGFRGLTFRTFLFLIYACGLRIREAMNLKIQDVNFSENTLALWKTKFHKERLIPFSGITAGVLKNYTAVRLKSFPPKSTAAAFFCHRGGRFRSTTHIEVRFRSLIHRTGIAQPGDYPHPRIHDLRHAFACHRLYKWYQDGCDIKNKLPLLTTYMGHLNVENTQVYLSVTLALLREADRRFQAGFEGIVKNAASRAPSLPPSPTPGPREDLP